MDTNIEERANREIWWVLVEIKNAYALTPKDNPVELNITEEKSENMPSPDARRKIIRQLENAGAIKIRKKTLSNFLGDNPALETLYGFKPKAFLLDVLQPKFGKVYEEYRKKNLDARTEITEPDEKKIRQFPNKLSAGTKWENITIKFLDNENVFIRVNQSKHETNYKEMGFEDKRGNGSRPNVQWLFLKVLAKVNGELSVKDPEAKDKYKKQKELLSKTLQSYFRIDYDPFFPYHSSFYKAGASYKIKLLLIPPQQREDSLTKEKDIVKDLDEQIKESFDEQTPKIYE